MKALDIPELFASFQTNTNKKALSNPSIFRRSQCVCVRIKIAYKIEASARSSGKTKNSSKIKVAKRKHTERPPHRLYIIISRGSHSGKSRERAEHRELYTSLSLDLEREIPGSTIASSNEKGVSTAAGRCREDIKCILTFRKALDIPSMEKRKGGRINAGGEDASIYKYRCERECVENTSLRCLFIRQTSDLH